MNFYLIDTNAYRALVAIDNDDKKAYSINTEEVQDMNELPAVDLLDVSSWDEISYDAICTELENEAENDINILQFM